MAEDLLAILASRGIPTVEVTGWRGRGGRLFAPIGVMVHHTNGTATDNLRAIIDGRADLAGPLAQFHIPKSGVVNIVADGRANHTGDGAPMVLDELRRDVAPSGTAAERGLADKKDFGANRFLYGIEAENLGNGKDPWPEAQLDAIRQTAAALCGHHRWPATRVIAHKEWTSRKVDPRGFEMADLRAAVAALLGNPITIEEGILTFGLAGTTPVPGGLPDALGRFPFWGWRRDGSVFAFNGAPATVPTGPDKKKITADGPVVALHARTDGVPGYYIIAGQPDEASGFPTFAFPKPKGMRTPKPKPPP